MQPIEKVLARLPNYSVSGKGFTSCCPAHDDRTPSLSITEASDGTVLLKCFAGCATEQVVNALGLAMRDLFPATTAPAGTNGCVRQSRTFSDVGDAVAAYRLGEPSNVWIYTDADGNELGRVLRWPSAARSKECRPLCKVTGGWTLTHMPPLRPLLHLPALLAAKDAPVFVVEGEKCVDAVRSLGLHATTSAGGSQAGRQSDWTPLAGRQVIILPDNDEAGDQYAATVRDILLGLGSKVWIEPLEGRPDNGGDVADLLTLCHSDADRAALQARLLSIATVTVGPAIPPTPAPEFMAYRPFPTASLPEAVRGIVLEAAKSIGCDEAAIALPCLSAMGVAAANLRVAIKDGWTVPPAIWTIIARPSGSQKSPALDISLDYFRKRQEELVRAHGKAAHGAAAGRPKTIWTDNATTEGLDEAFRSNPRGILYGCDELSGWLGTFGLYKSNGRSASDEGWYCQRYGGRASHIIRKTNGPLHGCASGLLGVTGCTTIDTLRSLLTRSVRECGLMARLVICIPPEGKRRWTDSTVSPASKQRYYSLLGRLLADASPRLIRLSPDAKALFSTFFDKHNEESERLGLDDLRAAYSKLEELPARLALILHAADGHSGDVSGDVMSRAIDVVEWAKHEAHRSYAILRPLKPDRPPAHTRLLELMARRGPVSVRQAQTGCRAYRGSASLAKAALDSLVEGGHARVMPDGTYACIEVASPDPDPIAVVAPVRPDPTPPGADTADTADVLTGEVAWTQL